MPCVHAHDGGAVLLPIFRESTDLLYSKLESYSKKDVNGGGRVQAVAIVL